MNTATRADSTVRTTELSNGLRVLGQEIPGVESAAAVFWVETGARDESADVAGVSHFLEHMAFKGTATRSYADVNREFEEMGAENNAFTWLEMTAFYARVLNEQMPRSIELLADITRPRLDPEDFEQERGVILEEIARHRDQPYSLVIDEFFHTLYPDQPLGRSTLGTPESIRALRAEQMKTYWSERYGPNNMLFSIAGKFDWEATVIQLEELTMDWKQSSLDRTRAVPQYLAATRVISQDRWNQEHLVIGVPTVDQRSEHSYALAVLANILGDDTGSRLFWSVNQIGLADSVGSAVTTFSDAGVLLVHAVTEPEKARQTLDVIREEMAKLQTGGISDEELGRAKTKLLTSTVLEGESTMARMFGLIDSWLSHGRLLTLQEVRESIERVSQKDIQELVHQFPLTENQVLVALGPLQESDLL
jgi:predicted Zn-dependent peptidase